MLATDIDSATASAAAAGGAEKRAYVKQIFSEIAPRYDLLNHVLSLNIDRRWRRKAIAMLGVERDVGGRYLDLCAGTLDVAKSISMLPGFRGLVIGADFAEPMLRAGAQKVEGRSVAPVTGDALQLPLAPGQLAGAIVAFGIRNVAGLDASLREVFRVLAPGARFVILEFSTPRFSPLRALYQWYFHHVLPMIGRAVSGHRTAYQYLPRSVANFPVEEELAERMTRAGFTGVNWTSLSFGVAAIHVGERPTSVTIK
ncbi:MAG TPA: ubiquinone/menaquinone biosynthesis methyltransferase [Gemmatimonadaceae bacterium]|jgi:demethylmenaquinone methyltransferase/2-methoxy-6-polyprenyl-1,4-benzoquinol methylase|nr:ubiquinone/menaquinone biosynthesis methyltransferase [Gemmatimonadaceae bacterium]